MNKKKERTEKEKILFMLEIDFKNKKINKNEFYIIKKWIENTLN